MKKNITKHDALVYALKKLNELGVTNGKIAKKYSLREGTLGNIARGDIVKRQRDKFLRAFVEEIDCLYRQEMYRQRDSEGAREILRTERNILLIHLGLPIDEERLSYT